MIDAPNFDPMDSSSRGWRSRSGVARIVAVIFLLAVAGGLGVILVRRFPLKRAERTPIVSTTTSTNTETVTTESDPPLIPPRPAISSLLSEPITRLITQEADLDGDGLNELAFVAIGNAESKGGSVDPSAWNAFVGVMGFDRTDKQWRLTYTEAIGGVDGANAAELFATTDLDNDTHPEILYSLHLAGSGQFRAWAVLSEQDGRLQKTTPVDLAYASYGFQGHNRVTLAPARLIEETFPIYKTDDPNCCASGGIRHLLFRFTGTAILLERTTKE